MRVFAPDEPIRCSGCNHVLPRVRITQGEAVLCCDARIRATGPCGQHNYILTTEDVSAVAPISRADYALLDRMIKRRHQMNRAIRRRLAQ